MHLIEDENITTTKSIFQTGKTYFCVRLTYLSAQKCIRKPLFFHAGGAPARKNPIFTCGFLFCPYAKIKIQKR